MSDSTVNSKSRVLFVCHSASRNGATILLLHLLRWLKERGDLRFEVLVNGRGDLLDDFRAICPTTVWRSPSFLVSSLPRRWQASLKPRLEAQSLKALLGGRQFDLVYVNTVAPWRHVPFLAKRIRSLLWHVHELEYAVRLLMGDEGSRKVFPLARRFIAVSESVCDCLVSKFGVPAEKIDMVNEFVSGAIGADERRAIRVRMRKELGWAPDAFVIGGCGTLGWRKGADVFLQVARLMAARGGGKCKFLWVGGGSREEELQFQYEMQAMKLEDRCRWVPVTPRVAEYYQTMDAFALTSREDPFPLVMLEAGQAGVPLVCFEGSGGGPEFAGRGAGLIAPYMDLAAYTNHLLALQNNDVLRAQLGTEAARQVQTSHTVETQAPKLWRCIAECLGRA